MDHGCFELYEEVMYRFYLIYYLIYYYFLKIFIYDLFIKLLLFINFCIILKNSVYNVKSIIKLLIFYSNNG